MINSLPAFVGFHQHNNCFGYVKRIDPFASSDVANGNGVRISGEELGCFNVQSCDNPECSIVVRTFGTFPFSHIYINCVFAQLAGLKEGQEVILQPVRSTACQSVEIIPFSNHDYEIMDRSSFSIENTFLQQITVVRKGQLLPLWISPGVHVVFKIASVSPDSSQPVHLTNFSELHVRPVVRSTSSSMSSPIPKGSRTKMPKLNKVEEVLRNMSIPCPSAAGPKLAIYRRYLPNFVIEQSDFHARNCHPNVIFAVNPEAAYTTYHLVSITHAELPFEHHFSVLVYLATTGNCDDVGNTVRELLEEKNDHFVAEHNDLLDYVNARIEGVKKNQLTILNEADVQIDTEEENFNTISKEIMQQIQSTSSLYPIVFGSSGFKFTHILQQQPVDIRILPSQQDLTQLRGAPDEYCFLLVHTTKLNITNHKQESDELKEEEVVPNFGIEINRNNQLLDLRYQQCLKKNIHEWVLFELTELRKLPLLAQGSANHVLVLGKHGCGKTAIVSSLAEKLATEFPFAYVVKVECSTWKGKQADSIDKMLVVEKRRLMRRRPSVLLLEDLDFMQITGEEEHRQIPVERIFNVIRQFLLDNSIPVIATAESLNSLHKSLVVPGGKRLFGQIVHIPALKQEDREDILHQLLGTDNHLQEAIKSTENFNVAELSRLATRIQVEARISGCSSFSSEDVAKALELSLKSGRPTPKVVAGYSLEKVGGMRKQKRLLTEVLIWPTKYRRLFDSCGIRLGQGVLLHGPSGCGKTLLANAFAHYTKFNVIAVKGPELLSKYIGSSEENVRNVFERARAAAPAVVIFDELDSLAPRRGHDSTGVTDRVVNQMLTELDGAEGLHGVYVIGCTSRLDMIDPALLRPGRFDHLMKCDLPDQEEREDIIKVVLEEILHDEIDISNLAKRTEKWSGADLRALFTNAQFRAIDRESGDETKICMEDVESVFEESRPKERQKQKEEFRAGQRVTLA